MYMHYHTDASIPSNGFRFRFSISASASPSCDQLTIGGGPGSGFITSPGYPTSYPHHADCRYRIDAGRSDRPITLTFTAFHLEDHSHCIYDYIEIRNGSEGNWSPTARKYCGTTTPAPLVIIGQRYVYIRFLSDVSVSGNGFQIQYNISDNSAPLPCTSTFNVRYTVHTSPLYYTPGYPNHSPHSLDCSYRINTPSGSDLIRVNFQHFNLERHTDCQYDYVAVYEGPNASSRLIGKYCGTNTSFMVTGRAPNMFIHYHTDDTVPSSGFRFMFRTWVRPASTPASCDQLSLGGGTGIGYITSPNYPNPYPGLSDCRYRINAGNSNRMITLQFLSFNVEFDANCNHDYVDVRLGGSGNWSPTSRRYCGVHLPTTQTITGVQYVYIRFLSDQSVYRPGFRLKYIISEPTLCNQLNLGGAPGSNGLIKSPGYPNNYPENIACNYSVSSSPPNNPVCLQFLDFNLHSQPQCPSEYVEIYDSCQPSASSVGKYCDTAPPYLSCLLGCIAMRFKTGLVTGIATTGFNVRYNVTGTHYPSSGEITSPSYPVLYPSNAENNYVIKPPGATRISLSFMDFNLQGSEPSCAFDSLTIKRGSESGTQLAKYCGEKRAFARFFDESQLTLVFRSDGSINRPGFRCRFNSVN
uniref:Tolloid-like protein 2 n=1 Tax=Ciona intestinalis TaxID=7719 RepID=F6XI54_CIOIN|nr:tolloid-like protein 2 [Ciona intestinalis]XP_026696348.1 tolloid-like protein 2 [Ciona intestinalis]|eukprot:XP_002128740.1 tolloid-like protein 2 [Ciona intestinalis]